MTPQTARMHFANSLASMWGQFTDQHSRAFQAAWDEAEKMTDAEAVEWARDAGYKMEAADADA
jgi:hypothetical protein